MPAPVATPTPDLVVKYRLSQVILSAAVADAMDQIVSLSLAPAFTNPLWRDRMTTHAQVMIDAYQEARGLVYPAEWEDVHMATLKGFDQYSQAGSLIQSAMRAIAAGDTSTGVELVTSATRHIEEGAAHTRFATILMNEMQGKE